MGPGDKTAWNCPCHLFIDWRNIQPFLQQQESPTLLFTEIFISSTCTSKNTMVAVIKLLIFTQKHTNLGLQGHKPSNTGYFLLNWKIFWQKSEPAPLFFSQNVVEACNYCVGGKKLKMKIKPPNSPFLLSKDGIKLIFFGWLNYLIGCRFLSNTFCGCSGEGLALASPESCTNPSDWAQVWECSRD